LLLRADGKLELLSEGGMLLGVLPATPYVSGSFQLGADDVLLIYSDGITESANSAGEEFGYAQLEDHLRRAQASGGASHPDGAESMLFSVLGAVQDFAASCPLVDDMSLAIVRRS
jgi:sigma-B regulation protein RsbU (phosphoserine phosphatase)